MSTSTPTRDDEVVQRIQRWIEALQSVKFPVKTEPVRAVIEQKHEDGSFSSLVVDMDVEKVDEKKPGAFASLIQDDGKRDNNIPSSHTIDPKKRTATAPWDRIVYFITILCNALELKLKDCFSAYRFHSFVKWYKYQRLRNKAPADELYLEANCETFIRRVTRKINWCVEKSTVIVSACGVSGRSHRPLSLWQIISNSASLAKFVDLCVAVFHDVAVHSGRKYAADKVIEFNDVRRRAIETYFTEIYVSNPNFQPGPQSYEIDDADRQRFVVFQAVKDAYRKNPSSISLDLADVLKQQSQGVKLEDGVIDNTAANTNEDALDKLMRLTSDAALEKGLPKTGYFVRLLRQATGTTNASKDFDDLDMEEMLDFHPGYHLSSIIQRVGELSDSLNYVLSDLLNRLCKRTLRGKSLDQVLEWLCRRHSRLIKGVELVAIHYQQKRIATLKASAVNPHTAQRLDYAKEMIELAFARVDC